MAILSSSSCSARPEDRAASFARLKRAIIERTGHHYYEDKDTLLRDRLDRRVQEAGCADLAEYLALLDHPERGGAEWQELEAEVTIGETFFFRHQEQFEALRMVVLPAIIAENAARRSLRIWSAGCAVGAEPYSLAILTEELLGEARQRWMVDIVGSDLSHRALAQAREGRFTSWALRGMGEAERARHFTPSVDRRQWRIADRLRRQVRFVQHNLLTLLDSPEPREWSGFDLILCRNVLIYFDPGRIAPMLTALARGLAPAGWLMVGHSDAIATLPHELGIVELRGTIAFRPPGRVPPPASAAPPLPRAAPQRPRSRLRETPPPIPSPVPSPIPPDAPVAGETVVAAIRSLADAGRLKAAAEACKAAIEAYPLDPRLHFYDGVIAQAAGERAQAEAALRRAIYLSGRMVMAQYHLGLLLLDGATPEAGRRVMAQVLALCRALPETEIVPESDGLSPRDLAERIEMRLRARPIQRPGSQARGA